VDPTKAFCDNPDCPARGKVGCGNIKVHSHKEQRFRCHSCNKTLAASKGTPLYRLHKERSLFVLVITLLAHGCPLQAIVAAFGLDERTVADWYSKSGSPARHGRFRGSSRKHRGEDPPSTGNVEQAVRRAGQEAQLLAQHAGAAAARPVMRARRALVLDTAATPDGTDQVGSPNPLQVPGNVVRL
jgi:transposase-like protein